MNDNMLKLMEIYPNYVDMSFHGEHLNHHHIWIHGDMGNTVSIIQEPFYKGENNLEFAVIYRNDLIYLEEHGDSVARYQTLEATIEFIERALNSKGGSVKDVKKR